MTFFYIEKNLTTIYFVLFNKLVNYALSIKSNNFITNPTFEIMKIKKITILAALLVGIGSGSQIYHLAANTEVDSSSETVAVETVKSTSDIISENWMYVTLVAILLVLMVLIGLILWTRRRKNSDA